MKFDIGNLVEYKGKDLIIIAGAPGSRWSGIYGKLAQHPKVNTSDWNDAPGMKQELLSNGPSKLRYFDDKVWNKEIVSFTGHEISIANHFGTYWGPGMKYGNKFDNLHALSKEEVLNELMQPFKNWDGIKVLRSHHWSYNLDYVLALFPECKLVMCYGDSIDCFYWWQKCGGFGMTYPSYSWYKDDIRMMKKIKEENYHILSFCQQKRVDIKLWNLKELFSELEIPLTEDFSIKFSNFNPENADIVLTSPLIGVYKNGVFRDSFYHHMINNKEKI